MWVLIQGLPPDAAFSRRGRMWTQSHELEALLVEKADMRLYQLVAMQADKASQKNIAKPVQITHPDRPESAPEPKKLAGPEDLARMFGGR